MYILCTKSLSHSGDIVWHKNWTQDLTAWLDHHDLPIQLKQMDVSKHGFKIMGMIRGYDSRKCNMHVVINFVYAISGKAQWFPQGKVFSKLHMPVKKPT